MDSEKFKSQILLNLHNSYSENYNQILGCCISLLITSLAILFGFGFILFQANDDITKDWLCFMEYDCNTESMVYNLNALSFITAGTGIVLTGIISILIYQGIAGRKEQFIVYSIRENAKIGFHLNNSMEEDNGCLPYFYHPFGEYKDLDNDHIKTKAVGLNIIQGLYGEIVKILIFITLIVYVLSFIKIIFGCISSDITLF